MKANKAINDLYGRLSQYGFVRDGNGLHYCSDGNEVDVYVSRGRVHVNQTCHPASEGWSMSTFKLSPRGVALAASRARSER